MANHIFISYSRQDQDYVRQLEDELRRRGFDPWVDARIDSGDRWWRTIVQQIRSCAAFVVVMTPEAEESHWVEKEVMLALEEGKPIFPLLLRGQRFPILINLQYVGVSGDRLPPHRFYERLGRALGLSAVPEPQPAPPPKPAPHLAGPPAAEPETMRPAVVERSQPFEPEMILIPAGEFLMGSDPRKDKDASGDEQPQHRLYLPDYTMARTPITQAQYAAFVQATGRRAPNMDADWVQPYNWSGTTPPGGKEDHPVVLVSWHDAVAYCHWLAEATGKPYRLPTEAEWEKAARGTDGLIYPWGNEWDPQRCNFGEGGSGGTTAVGTYPRGASPYELLDMAGNVWEWCSSLHRGYPYRADDGREDSGASGSRVVRGGSFLFHRYGARCAVRLSYNPDNRDYNLGFRVVVSPI